jgi:hypothetical protein
MLEEKKPVAAEMAVTGFSLLSGLHSVERSELNLIVIQFGTREVLPLNESHTNTERSDRVVVDYVSSQVTQLSMSRRDPVATAPGSVFVRRCHPVHAEHASLIPN